MKRELARLALFSAVVLSSGCGGGGGGSGTGAASASPPSPPPPPSTVMASRVDVAELPSDCPPQCLYGNPDVFIDASGEITVFWRQLSPSAGGVFTANIASGSNAVLSRGRILAEYLPERLSMERAQQIAPRRFVLSLRHTPGTESQSMIVDLGAVGAPVGSEEQPLPTWLRLPTIHIRDAFDTLYVVSRGRRPPFPSVELGAGVTAKTTAAVTDEFTTVEWTQYAQFDSIAPLGLLAFVGREKASDDLAVYWAPFDLTDGHVPTAIKVSQQPITLDSLCFPGLLPRSFGPGLSTVAWRVLNAARGGCELYVDGQRLSTEGMRVETFDIAGRNEDVIAVWLEEKVDVTAGLRPTQILWSRRDSATTQWSAPAAIDSKYQLPGIVHHSRGIVTGPQGTVAVIWSPCSLHADGNGCSYQDNLVSKYVNGSWTTTSAWDVLLLGELKGIAINGAGEGAMLVTNSRPCSTDQGKSCTFLSVHRL